MDIKLWYNEDMKMWRWTLIDRNLNMETGQRPDLRDAMQDIANTVEYLVAKSISNS